MKKGEYLDDFRGEMVKVKRRRGETEEGRTVGESNAEESDSDETKASGNDRDHKGSFAADLAKQMGEVEEDSEGE